jgi:hypothetical protein
LSLPVGGFIVLTSSIQPTYQKCGRVAAGCETTKQYLSDKINVPYDNNVGLDISVGIATGYRLDGPGIDSRWGARFSVPVQTGPGAHSASCTRGTGSSWGKRAADA